MIRLLKHKMIDEPVHAYVTLENVQTSSDLESAAMEAEAFMELQKDGMHICRLRFYFKKVEVLQDIDFKFHCLSLCAQVLDKNAEVKRISFNITVDCMTASLSVHNNKIPERKMTILFGDDAEEIVIVKHFLCYNYVPTPTKDFSGETRKEMYLMASVGTFRYRISVTMFDLNDSKKPRQELESTPTLEFGREVVEQNGNTFTVPNAKEYMAEQFINAARNYWLTYQLLDDAKAILDTRDPNYENLDTWFDIINGITNWDCDINESEEGWMEECVKIGKKIGIDHFSELIEEIMIKLCSNDNMFELHALAKKYHLETALVRIVKFIKMWQVLMYCDFLED